MGQMARVLRGRPGRAMSAAAAIVSAALMASTAMTAEAPEVVVTIKPVHSLVAGLMAGVGEPALLITGAASPHSYSMRPSEARALEGADVVVWVGEGLETFLERPLQALAADARVVELAELEGMRLLAYREGGPWERHAHDHDDDQNHGHDHDHDHGHDHGHDDDHDHDDHGRHRGHGIHDMHLWLDPMNAVAMVEGVAAALAEDNPAHADRYRDNAAAVTARLEALHRELEAELADVRQRPYVVFHDAYQYFEARYGLNPVGSITVSPEQTPGAARLTEIRERIAAVDAVCVFSEPQFEPALIAVVTEGTKVRTGVLDPLGADLEAGPDTYVTLMRNLSASLRDCLLPAS